MRKMGSVAALVAAVCSMPVMAQTNVMPVASTNPPPVPQAPPVDSETPEQIAKDAARDLTPTRFYNKPGATRADYDAAWQDCRLIARGSRTPSGPSVFVGYGPTPAAAAMGAGSAAIGNAIGMLIIQGEQRRANRQSCMLIRGWRLVRPNAAQAAAGLAMDEAARTDYLNAQIGAATVVGDITERKSFGAPDAAAFHFAAPPVTGSFWFGSSGATPAPFTMGAQRRGCSDRISPARRQRGLRAFGDRRDFPLRHGKARAHA